MAPTRPQRALLALLLLAAAAVAGGARLPAAARDEYGPIEIYVDGNGVESAGTGPADGGAAAPRGAAAAMEGSSENGVRRAAVIGGAVGGCVLLLLAVGTCVCCVMARRGGYRPFVVGGSLSDRDSLAALREFASGGISGETGEGEGEGGFGGWWRRRGSKENGRYAADSLELEFAKPAIPVRRLAHGEEVVDGETGMRAVDFADESGHDGGSAARRESRRESYSAARGASTVGEPESAWAQVEQDVTDFDYVIGLGPAGGLDEWTENVEADGAGGRGAAVECGGGAPDVVTGAAVSRVEMMDDADDPPLVNPYNFRRYPAPS